MSDSICTHPDCETPVGKHGAKGLCPKHYRASRGPCAIEGCASVISSKGLCAKHAWRLSKTGSTEDTPSGRKVYPAGQVCSVDGCESPRRKVEWCSRHYALYRRKGSLEALYEWRSDEGGPCVVCGKAVEGRKKYCTPKCLARLKRHPDGRPDSVKCNVCGDEVSTTEKGKAGWLRRIDTLHCDRCRRARYTRHRTSLNLVVQHQGDTTCGICGFNVDISLRNPDPLAPEVDHILPWALGGTHEIENLQLSHARCNRRKQARADYQSTLAELIGI